MLQELGYGLTREIVSDVVRSFLQDAKRVSPFKEGHPGPDWWRGFMRRWPSLSERKPQHLSAKWAAAGSQETLDSWFSLVKSFLIDKGLLKRGRPVADFASRLWNADETGFCLGAASKKILARRGDRCIHEVGGASDHQFITVNACGNAEGLKLPPFILCKGKNLYTTWTHGGPAGAVYSTSQSGWMEEANYVNWFEKQFYPAVKHLLDTGPVVLFLDGHYSHMSINLIKRARALNIHLFCLPPNTTHLLQPLDVGVFGLMKQRWRAILKQYKLETKATNVTKQHFPGLIHKLWDSAFTPEHLKSAFRATGLVPFDPHVLKPRQVAPSLPTGIVEVELTGTITVTRPDETPLRTELREYFCGVLRPVSGPHQKPQRRRMVRLHCTGEVLTNDEVLERLEQADIERASKKKGKKKQRNDKSVSKQPKATCQATLQPEVTQECDPVYCGGCKQLYTDAEWESWVGCDRCEAWWHYWCAGFEMMPEEEEEWLCDFCLT